MEKRSGSSRRKTVVSGEFLPLAFLLICFVFAGILGCSTIVHSGQSSGASLSLYLHRYMTLLSEGSAAAPSVLSVFCEFFLFPLILFFLGLTTLGVFVIPLTLSLRAFLLAYAIAAFMQVFGTAGIGAGLALFGFSAFVSTPVLITVGSFAFSTSLQMAQGALGLRVYKISLIEYVSILLPCSAFLFPAAFLQWSVAPQLLFATAKSLILN